MVCGPSLCGKSVFVEKLIDKRNEIFYPKPLQITWHYGEIQPLNKIKNVNYIKGLPESESICCKSIVVIDDLFLESRNSNDVTNLFTRVAHHRQSFIIFITQNLFHNSTQNRTRMLNTHYLVLFKSPRDKTFIKTIAFQMQLQFLPSVFNDATSQPYNYLFIDLHTDTPDEIRIRSNILFEKGKFIEVYKQCVKPENKQKNGKL